jgi:hypothetical protein
MLKPFSLSSITAFLGLSVAALAAILLQIWNFKLYYIFIGY